MHGIKENKAELHYLMPSSFEYVETRKKMRSVFCNYFGGDSFYKTQ